MLACAEPRPLQGVELAISLATRGQIWLTRIPFWLFALGIVALGFLKSGFTIISVTPEPLDTFPEPRQMLTSLSYGMRSLAWLLRTEADNAYTYIGLTLTVLTLILGAWFIRRSIGPVDARVITILVLLGPIGIILMNNIGRHDVFVLLGALLIGTLGRSVPWAALGALLMVLGNPEQACIAAVMLLVISLITPLSHLRSRALTALLISFGSFLVLSTWARASGVSGREGYINEFFGNSIYGFFGNFPLSIFCLLYTSPSPRDS